MAKTRQDLDELEDELEQTSTEQTDSTTQKQASRQTSTNWHDDPEYRRQQSQSQKELNEARRMAAEATRRAQEVEMRFQQWQMQQLPVEQQSAYQVQILQQELARLQQEREYDAYAIKREMNLTEIARRLKVPKEIFDDLPPDANVHDAWLLAEDWKEANPKGKSRSRLEEIDEEADDTVDFSAPKATSRQGSIQAEYDKARKNHETGDMLVAMAKADRYGVTLNEW